MTTRKVGNLEGSMTHPSVAASAEVAVYASWAEIANMPIIHFLSRFAEKKNATPAQISLAWLLA
jgi:aryl-alcohol dehydrogenase-like predicted oxidoreductase